MPLRKTNLERFKENGCWIWTASKTRDGYGHFWTGEYINKYDSRSGPVMDLAHRWIFKEYNILLNGNYVLHKCDVTSCVNPEHLFQGTQRTNIKDCVGKKRHPWMRKVFSDEEVQQIRNNYTGTFGETAKIARKYEVATNVISEIVKDLPKFYGKHL